MSWASESIFEWTEQSLHLVYTVEIIAVTSVSLELLPMRISVYVNVTNYTHLYHNKM